MKESDLPNVMMFLGLPSIRPKIALDMTQTEHSLREFIKNPNLGNSLISGSNGRITGVLVYLVEFAEQKKGD